VALSAVEPLSDLHDLAGFECGKAALDDWLRTFARSNQRQDFTRVMVIHEDGKVVGYYGLAPSAIDPGAAPRRVRTGRPPDPIPCLLIGQLAVDRRHQGRGIGSMLIADAFRRCVAGAEIIGGRAIVVRAIDTEAEAYWQSWGFVPARDNPSILMRSIADIRATLLQ
jgi:GNAT superfamily N-acetyltransferase